jgi:phage minor structural protein, N-terminal domain protein|nr:MAG TPA: Neck appendage protein [Caudoviricetes sp.]
MIYLTEGNTPLNEAYNDEIVQERNNTYQLTFRFPTSDPKWELLKEETFLTADDLHGEQDFYIFEVEKQQGYIQVYANQVISLLNNYIISSIDVDRVSGTRVLSALAGSITRTNPFSFFSDIDDRHTLNIKDKNAMEVLAKDKHSILGQWGGDMVRNGYNLRLLKNGGSENESLFMYKKNLSSYQHKTSTKSLKTRITFKTTVKGEGEKAPDVDYVVVIDSPLLGKYSQIYEAVVEVNDQNVKDQASLIEYGKQYFRTSMCDMLEDNLEISVVGQSDVAVRMFDVVSIYHEWYGLDVRKKITKYTYSPMAKRLKSIGFGTFQSSLANAIGGIVNDAVLNESRNLHKIFEERLKKEIANADRAFDAEFAKREKDITNGIELAKAKAEEVKQELSDTINQRFNSFDNGPLQEVKRRAEEALRNAGASSLLAQEAKRIGLDSVAKLEAFKAQTTSAQTALSGDLDALKRTIANDVRPKQAQTEAEIAKQVEALNKTKNELAGVKSAQATYEETTTRRLAELTNLANGKASKSELTQTAEELASKIASVKVGGRNYYRDSEKIRTSTRFFSFPLHPYLSQENVGETWTLSFDLKINEGGEIRLLHFYHYQTNRFGLKASADITPSKDWQRFTFTGPVIFPNDDPRYARGEMALYDYGGNNNYSVRRIKFERGTVATDWSPAIEDTDGKISAVESNFRQRADALDAGVRSLTEGLRTKADISSLNVTAENIKQTVKRLETDTQNKLDQKLNLAEFEVQAGSIRQEILNATKDKADKTLVVAEAGKLREEFSKIQVGGRNHYRDSEKVRTSTRFFSFPLHPYLTQENVGETWTLSFDLKINEGGEIRPLHFYHYQSNRFGLKASADITPSKEWQRFTFTGPVIFPNDDHRYSRGEMALYDYGGNNNYSVRRIKLEKGTLATDWSPAIEDTDGLITEAKAIFERTAQGLRTDLSAIQEYVNKDGQRQEALQRYTREESAKQATAVRELVAKDYVGKTTYQEDVKGINQKIEAVKTSANKEIANQIASYRQSVDGKFTDISSQMTTYKQDVGGQISGLSNRLTSSEQGTTNQISNLKTQVSANKADADSQFKNMTNQLAQKVETTDFQRVKETSQLYERILGNTENGIADKVARMAMTNQLFQVEVSKNEGLKTVQRQLAGSWAVQNINSAGDIISGINLGANGHNRITGKLTHITGDTLIDNAVIKSAMIDKLKTANFEAGSVTTKILDAEAVTADKVRFDDAFISKMIANEAFINQLTSKRIFATKVESVITSSTVLEGYKGWIGGFQLGTHDSGYGRWITGRNQFSVGMGNGEGGDGRTALWVNWGYNWSEAGYYAWYVKNNGKMYCKNTAEFWKTPIIHGDLKVTGKIFYDNRENGGGAGNWVYSENYSKIDPDSGYLYLYYNSSGYNWIPMNKEISDRRYKSNIQDSQVSGLDVIEKLKTYSYRKEYDGKIEDIACGIMAQDVQKYAPEAFYENPDGAYSYRTFELVPYLIKAIQELNQKIEKMEKQ